MNIQFVVFAYREERELLLPNLEHIGWLRGQYPGHEMKVHVADDAACPCFESEEDALAAGVDSWEQTDFPRGERINGLACLDGMLDVYRRVAVANPDADWICQLDCDTVVQHLGWLEECPAEAVFTGCMLDDRALDFAFGSTIAFNQKALDCVDEALAIAGVRERLAGCDCFTDRSMTYLCQMGGGNTHLYMYKALPDERICGAGFATLEGAVEGAFPLFSHLVFEKRMLPASIAKVDKIARCAELMREYLVKHDVL